MLAKRIVCNISGSFVGIRYEYDTIEEFNVDSKAEYSAFYRAMHFSAKRGIAIACRLSVSPSVRPSVCDVGRL